METAGFKVESCPTQLLELKDSCSCKDLVFFWLTNFPPDIASFLTIQMRTQDVHAEVGSTATIAISWNLKYQYWRNTALMCSENLVWYPYIWTIVASILSEMLVIDWEGIGRSCPGLSAFTPKWSKMRSPIGRIETDFRDFRSSGFLCFSISTPHPPRKLNRSCNTAKAWHSELGP